MFILFFDNCKVDLILLEEDLIDYVIKYVKFWIYIFGVRGKYKVMLEGYLMYLLMRNIYVDMFINF